MEIQTQSCDDVVVVRVKGELKVGTWEIFKAAIEGLIAQDRSKLVLDMTQLTRADSGGFGMLLWAMKTMRARGGDMHLFGPVKEVLEVIELMSLDRTFRILQSEQEAVDSFGEEG